MEAHDIQDILLLAAQKGSLDKILFWKNQSYH